MSTTDPFDRHCMALGRLIVAFQSLEGTLVHGLVLLANNQIGTPGGHLVYAAMSELSFGSASRLASALPSMFTEQRLLGLNETERSKVMLLLEQCATNLAEGLKIATALEQRRNQLVHSKWFISPEIFNAPGTMTRMKAKTKNGTSTVSFETEAAEDIERDMDRAKKSQSLIAEALSKYLEISSNYCSPRNAA